MSLHGCQSGTTGFPVNLSQNLFSTWPGTTGQDEYQALVTPTDFEVKWAPPTQLSGISVRHTTSVFQITGLDIVSNGTTLNYGDAEYTCSPTLSILQNQHKKLSNRTDALYEMILAFQLKNKYVNPSSPDVILICRPLISTPNATIPLWTAVNDAVKTDKPQGVSSFDLSSLYAYNQDVLMPMVTYSTCLPVKLLNYKGADSQLGNINMRVHVVTQPMYITADTGGTGLCSIITKYTLALPSSPVRLFREAAWNAMFQFQDGLGTDSFPSGATTNLIPVAANKQITDYQTVLQTFEYLVPEEFLGKSLAEIAAAKSHAPKASKKKAFKCYKIDPEMDIKDDQIMIDPTTGESLSDTMKQKAYDDSGGDPALLNIGINGPDTSGIMPGDVQHILFVVFTALGSIFLLAYIMYILHKIVYNDNGFNMVMYHILIFIALLIGLILIGVYAGEGN